MLRKVGDDHRSALRYLRLRRCGRRGLLVGLLRLLITRLRVALLRVARLLKTLLLIRLRLGEGLRLVHAQLRPCSRLGRPARLLGVHGLLVHALLREPLRLLLVVAGLRRARHLGGFHLRADGDGHDRATCDVVLDGEASALVLHVLLRVRKAATHAADVAAHVFGRR